MARTRRADGRTDGRDKGSPILMVIFKARLARRRIRERREEGDLDFESPFSTLMMEHQLGCTGFGAAQLPQCGGDMAMTDPCCSTFHLLAMKFPTFFGRAELYFFFPALSLSFSRFY